MKSFRVVAVLPWLLSIFGGALPAGAVDHFLCYQAKTTKGAPKFEGTTVDLADQFEDKRFDVRKTRYICTPADKNGEGVSDAVTRLGGYKIKSAKGEPRHTPQVALNVTNQFGSLTVDTRSEDLLLVPAAVCIDQPPGSCPGPLPPPPTGAHEVDHFKCYRIKGSKGAPRFEGSTVSVEDQLTPGTRSLQVVKPRHLCLAANKNGEGIKDAGALILCYKAKPAKGQPQHVPIADLGVSDQLGSQRLDTKKEAELCVPSNPATLGRPADPVVLSGADVPSLLGIPPGDLVAFAHALGWVQIPVQVDERDIINLDDVYNHIGGHGGGITLLDYTDAGTFTGPDANPLLDSDDEIVFMAKDAGSQAGSAGLPPGVVPNSGVEVTISDPLGPDVGYVYLFRRSGSLDPSAGRQYVDYQFALLSGDYLATYQIGSGPNPEDSNVTSAFYARRFADRWVQDELRIFAGLATGADILDRHKNLFAPGVCGRSEDTFSAGEGAFIINKSGPVRAIRSYVGANSGPRTQRQHLFYERREDIRTFLRVHAIPGMMDFFDYSPGTTGMTYRNDLNVGGVTIDGVPDTVAIGAPAWEMVTGPQGSLLVTGVVTTDIAGLAPSLYYLDDSMPPVTQCTGDAFAYGSSGLWINQSIPNTDPIFAGYSILQGDRILYYDVPGLSVSGAQKRHEWATNPLVHTANPWP